MASLKGQHIANYENSILTPQHLQITVQWITRGHEFQRRSLNTGLSPTFLFHRSLPPLSTNPGSCLRTISGSGRPQQQPSGPPGRAEVAAAAGRADTPRRADLPTQRPAEPPPARVGPRGASGARQSAPTSALPRAQPQGARRAVPGLLIRRSGGTFCRPHGWRRSSAGFRSATASFSPRCPRRDRGAPRCPARCSPSLTHTRTDAHTDTKAPAPPPQEVPLPSLSRRIGLLGAERRGAGRRAGCHSARCHARCPQRLKRSAALSPLCNGGWTHCRRAPGRCVAATWGSAVLYCAPSSARSLHTAIPAARLLRCPWAARCGDCGVKHSEIQQKRVYNSVDIRNNTVAEISHVLLSGDSVPAINNL